MKKFLTFVLVLVAVLSVSSVALAAEKTVPYNASNTALVNGKALFNTIMTASDGDTIKVPAGIYELTDGETSRIAGKSVTLVGEGEGVTTLKGEKYGLVIQNTAGNHVDFTIKNMTIESLHSWGHSIYVKGDTAVNLENVTLTNPGTTVILVESINCVEDAGGNDVFEDNITASVNAKGVTIDSGDTVEMETKPNSGISDPAAAGMNTRAEFTYSSDCKNITDDICKSRSSNLGFDNVFVNGKCINPAVAQIGDTKYTSLQDAINAAQDAARTQPETVTIKLLADVSKDVTIKQEENLNLVIDGDDHKMTGTINIYGDSRYTGAETLTIQNIAFEKDSGDAIWSDSTDGDKRYAHNVFIKDCTFTGDAIVGTRIRQGYNINVIGCEMTSGHSLMQNTNNTGITVRDTTIKNATEGGLNLFASTGVLVEGCDITAKDYGVRVNADGSGDATIKDTKIDAEQPVIVRYNTGSYDLTAKEGNVFTVGEGKSPVNIEDSSKVTYTDNFVAMNGTTNTYYNSWDKAIADAKPGETVYHVENGDIIQDGAETIPVPEDEPTKKPASSGIKVTYNGGNSFSTSKSAVPTSVEIDGVAVGFTGDGKLFTVNSIPAGAKWVTVRWNSTSVTTNFTPNGAYFAEVEIPKTGDASLWAAVAEFLGF